MRLLIVVIMFSIFGSACKSTDAVDTIVKNGVVYTVNEKFDTVQAFAVKDGKIIATGTNLEILNKYTAKETIDAKGQAVYPGFIDAHAHFLGYGQSLFMVDLYGAASWEEVIGRVKKFATEHPEEKWIKGRGWDQNKWPGKSYPTNEELNLQHYSVGAITDSMGTHLVICLCYYYCQAIKVCFVF